MKSTNDDFWTFRKCLAEFGITLELRDGRLFSVEKVTDQDAIDFIKLYRAAIIEELKNEKQ